MLPLFRRATRRAWQRASSCVRRQPPPLSATSLGDVPPCRRLSSSTRTRAVSQFSSGSQQPWSRAPLTALAEEFTRAAAYEEGLGFDNAQGQQRFSDFLYDLLCRAKKSSAGDQATYKAVAALATEAQQYHALRVPQRALLLVRPWFGNLATCLVDSQCPRLSPPGPLLGVPWSQLRAEHAAVRAAEHGHAAAAAGAGGEWDATASGCPRPPAQPCCCRCARPAASCTIVDPLSRGAAVQAPSCAGH